MPLFLRFRVLVPLGVLAALVLGVVITTAGPSSASVSPQARAELVNAAGDPLGTVTFLGHGGHATQLRVELDLPLPANDPGLNAYHGLHVHKTGACVAPFTTAEGHWDDGTHTHGFHLGDLPSVLVGADGEGSLTADVPRFDVKDVAGRAIILHAGRDNFGNVPIGTGPKDYESKATAEEETAKTGNAGARYGCGVIEAVGS